MNLQDDIFVVASEGDGVDIDSPLILETHVDIATKQNAQGFARRLGSKYGKTKIGRVVFNDIDQVNAALSASTLLLPDNTKVDELLASITLIMENSNDQVDVTDSQAHAISAHMRLTVLQWLRTL